MTRQTWFLKDLLKAYSGGDMSGAGMMTPGENMNLSAQIFL